MRICSNFNEADFIALQETRVMGKQEWAPTFGYKHFYSGLRDERKYGVGLLVKASISDGVQYVNPVNERILIIAGTFRGTKQCIASVYGPAHVEDKYENEARVLKFFWELTEALDRIPEAFAEHKEHCILLGDFNARVGRAEEGEAWHPIIGNGIPSAERRQPDGYELLRLCASEGLIIANSHFTNPCGSWGLWGSGRYEATNDHILVSDGLLVDQCVVSTDFILADMTDHLPSILRMRVPKASQDKTSSAKRHVGTEEDKPPKAKINYALLRSCEDKATKVRDEVDNKILDMDHDADIHAQYQEMVTIVRETCKELLTESELDAVSSSWFKRKQKHLSNLLRIEQHRRIAYNKFPDNPIEKKQEAYELYRQALNQSKSEIRIARGEFWDDVTKKLEEAFNMNDQGRFNKLVASTFSSTRKKRYSTR